MSRKLSTELGKLFGAILSKYFYGNVWGAVGSIIWTVLQVVVMWLLGFPLDVTAFFVWLGGVLVFAFIFNNLVAKFFE